MLKAVFFDLDETLIESGEAFHLASRAAFAAFGLDYDEHFRHLPHIGVLGG